MRLHATCLRSSGRHHPPTSTVVSTDIQHIESIAPTIHAITGITVRETVPDWVPLSASETVMVDLTPEALQNRMRRGDVYGREKVEQSLKNFFRRGNLIALRELALRQVAEQVDRSLESYMDSKDIRENWGVRERLAVCVSGNSSGQYLISRAARLARKMDAELYVVHVEREFGKRWEDGKRLEGNLHFGENLGAQVVRLKGRSVADTIAEFVRNKHITQVRFGRNLPAVCAIDCRFRPRPSASELRKFLRAMAQAPAPISRHPRATEKACLPGIYRD